MKSRHRILLIIDCVVNILLGVLLILFPFGIIRLFGLPETDTNFYPSILGAVLIGIGLALLLELVGFQRHIRGLGLGGAIAINTIGSVVLISWLVIGSLNIPVKGQIILWIVGLMVLAIGVVELATKSWRCEE